MWVYSLKKTPKLFSFSKDVSFSVAACCPVFHILASGQGKLSVSQYLLSGSEGIS